VEVGETLGKTWGFQDGGREQGRKGRHGVDVPLRGKEGIPNISITTIQAKKIEDSWCGKKVK